MKKFLLIFLLVLIVLACKALPATTFTCANAGLACGNMSPFSYSGSSALDEQVAQDSLQNDPYTDETRYLMRKELYARLVQHPELLTNQTLASFYSSMQNSLIAQFEQVDAERFALFSLDSAVAATINANHAQIKQNLALTDSLSRQVLSGQLSPADSASVSATIAGLRQATRNLITFNATALKLAETSRILTADNVKAVNANLGTNAVIEENERQVNDIYLATIARSTYTFSPGQAATLQTIAQQCPLAGGNAVFQARSIYSLISNGTLYNDQAVCLQQGILTRQQQKVSAVSVYPNPASNAATLVYELPEEATGLLVLYNTLGQEVSRRQLDAKARSLEFSTANLAEGMYYYSVFSGGKPLGSGKLSIIR